MLISTFPSNDNPSFLLPINSNDKISSLKNGKHLIRCAQKTLYKEGEQLSKLFYLISGTVVLHKTDFNGKEIKLHELKKGSFFGFNILFDCHNTSHTATVKKDSLLLVIPLIEFKNLLIRQPNLQKQMICQLIHQLDLTEMKIFGE